MQTGNSPTMISKAMMIEMLPRWDLTVRAIHADLEADKALGWAQEMFAFSLALANHPMGPPEISYHQEFMAQPPFDKTLIFDMCQVCIDSLYLNLKPWLAVKLVFGVFLKQSQCKLEQVHKFYLRQLECWIWFLLWRYP